jgi:hypothetical protein
MRISFILSGPHCKNESQLSIIWQKAIAGQTVIKHCPGRIKNGKEKERKRIRPFFSLLQGRSIQLKESREK